MGKKIYQYLPRIWKLAHRILHPHNIQFLRPYCPVYLGPALFLRRYLLPYRHMHDIAHHVHASQMRRWNIPSCSLIQLLKHGVSRSRRVLEVDYLVRYISVMRIKERPVLTTHLGLSCIKQKIRYSYKRWGFLLELLFLSSAINTSSDTPRLPA